MAVHRGLNPSKTPEGFESLRSGKRLAEEERRERVKRFGEDSERVRRLLLAAVPLPPILYFLSLAPPPTLLACFCINYQMDGLTS